MRDISPEIKRVLGEYILVKYPEPVVIEFTGSGGLRKVIRIVGEARSLQDRKLFVRLEEEAFTSLLKEGAICKEGERR